MTQASSALADMSWWPAGIWWDNRQGNLTAGLSIGVS